MRELLRCGVKAACLAFAMICLTSHASHVRDGPTSSQTVLDRPLEVAENGPTRPRASHQNLRLDCDKVGKAQRTLRDARHRGAQLTPAAPAASVSAPPTRDEIYHVSRNEERFAGLAQQFRCGTG